MRHAGNVTVLIVDDHTILRQGIRALLEAHPDIEVVGEAAEGPIALELIARHRPGIVLVDICSRRANGTELTKRIAEVPDGPSVLGFVGVLDEACMDVLLKAGARGCIRKESGVERLVDAILAVADGETYFDGVTVADCPLAVCPERTAENVSRLSPRERQVLQAIAEGRSTKRIASDLGLSAKTIETHRKHIIEKLGVDNVAEMTKIALRSGMTHL